MRYNLQCSDTTPTAKNVDKLGSLEFIGKKYLGLDRMVPTIKLSEKTKSHNVQ